MQLTPTITYGCPQCNEKFLSIETYIQHIANRHYGLTIEEYHTWKTLCKQARQAGYTVSHTKNAKTDAAFDAACKALSDFEIAHNLTNKEKPLSFLT